MNQTLLRASIYHKPLAGIVAAVAFVLLSCQPARAAGFDDVGGCQPVPALEGLTLEVALPRLDALELSPEITGPDDDTAVVAKQDPVAGTFLCVGDEQVVGLTTQAPSCDEVADVTGWNVERAAKSLQRTFKVEVDGPTRDPAIVIRQHPEGGQTICEGNWLVTLWTATPDTQPPSTTTTDGTTTTTEGTTTTTDGTTTTTTAIIPPTSAPPTTTPPTTTPTTPPTTAPSSSAPPTTAEPPPSTTTTNPHRPTGSGRPPYQWPIVGSAAAVVGLATVRIARSRRLHALHAPDVNVSVHSAEPSFTEEFEPDQELPTLRLHIESPGGTHTLDDQEMP